MNSVIVSICLSVVIYVASIILTKLYKVMDPKMNKLEREQQREEELNKILVTCNKVVTLMAERRCTYKDAKLMLGVVGKHEVDVDAYIKKNHIDILYFNIGVPYQIENGNLVLNDTEWKVVEAD